MRETICAMLLVALFTLGGCSTQASNGAKETVSVSGATPTAVTTAAATTSAAIVATPTTSATTATPVPSATHATYTYKDGVYEYKSIPDPENYYVKGSVTVKGGKIAAVDWGIYDAARSDKLFDKDYEAVFADEVYKQQCRDNLKGMAEYTPRLIEKQDIFQVDAVSGATWAYDNFYKMVSQALRKAYAK